MDQIESTPLFICARADRCGLLYVHLSTSLHCSRRIIGNHYKTHYEEYMTKAEVVKSIADTTGVDRQEVLQVVEAFMDTVKNAMSQGDNVYLRGFGSFVVKERAEKTARNISKQTTIIVPARKVPTFKPSKAFTAIIK